MAWATSEVVWVGGPAAFFIEAAVGFLKVRCSTPLVQVSPCLGLVQLLLGGPGRRLQSPARPVPPQAQTPLAVTTLNVVENPGSS